MVYADKKRTIPLLRGMGFKMPMSLLRDGSIGRISYSGQNVNISGERFSSVVSNNAEGGKYSLPGVEDILKKDQQRSVAAMEQAVQEHGAIPKGEKRRDTLSVIAKATSLGDVTRAPL